MSSLAIFLYPDRVGISDIKRSGSKPSFAPPRWVYIEDAAALLDEPINFASLIRNEIGEKGRYDIYLSVWPGAYRSLLFSHGKRRKSDVERLLHSELETVFRGGQDELYTYNMMFDKGRYSFGGKSRRMIFVVRQNHINLMLKSFAARKLKLRRIVPFTVDAAEAALTHWAPAKKDLSACIHLDDAGTTVSVFKNGAIQAIRTVKNGFDMVLHDYVENTQLSLNVCRQIILNSGLYGDDDFFQANPHLQDRVAVACDQIITELVRALHSLAEDQPMPEQVLLCGPYAKAAGLADYLSTRLNTQCIPLTAELLSPKAVSAIALDTDMLEDFFPFAMSTSSKGVDLLANWKKNRSGLINSIIASCFLVVIAAFLMAITPVQMKALQQERDAAEALLQQSEYVAVQELLDQRQDTQNAQTRLEDAIAALVHGGSDMSGIVNQLYDMTSRYGTVQSMSVDYESESIQLAFTTVSYDMVVDWQEQIKQDARYSFLNPPTFSGSGVTYSVSAEITCTDFTEEMTADNTEEVAE